MAIIKKYKARVEKIIKPLPDIYTVTFFSDKKFIYNPGQFLHLALDDYDGIGQWPESRCFSMQSISNDPLIKITYAVKGSYTNRMKNELYEGKEVWLKLPYRDIFDRGHSKENCVFIAGGTGITPFLSLFTHESFSEYANPKIYLKFKSEVYNIYKSELDFVKLGDYFGKLCGIKIFYEDIKGMLDIENIFEENKLSSTYFISGLPIMIKSFKQFLIENDISKNKIITDDWE